jgi:hypothetical protein
MGLGSKEIPLLIKLAETGHIGRGGAVIEIGAQQLSDSFLERRESLERLASLYKVSLPCPLPAPLAQNADMPGSQQLAAQAPPASMFWRWLGYKYLSIDIDGSAECMALDLNYDSVPRSHLGAYQIVTNCGTTEHVANQLNAFKVIHELTSLHGVMIHNLPAQGMFNHGLINYNPKFFWMLARSNGYKLLHMSFNHDDYSYPLPQNILDSMAPFDPPGVAELNGYKAADCAIVVAVKKIYDTPFVSPIDVDTGTPTKNEALRERYWSVFKPHPFETFDGAQQVRGSSTIRARLLRLLERVNQAFR